MNAVMPRRPRSVLICTLGATWAVIPEVYGWLAPDHLDLYRWHPDRDTLDRTRCEHGLEPPDELWVCTTGGARASKSVGAVISWWSALGPPAALRVWMADGTDELASSAECEALRELTMRLVLRASDLVGETGVVMLSLAGGRKTMSADLQHAGELFGARAWLHVVGPEQLPEALRVAAVDTFLEPLSAEVAVAVQPLVVGGGTPQDSVGIPVDGWAIAAERFALPDATPGQPLRWRAVAGDASLVAEIEKRQRESGRLLVNFVASLQSDSPYEPWGGLLRLPPARLEKLRHDVIDVAAESTLARLPLADLHCHLGGCLDLAGQKKVAESVWADAKQAQRAEALDAVAPLLQEKASSWPSDWPQLCRQAPSRALASAALLLHSPPERLEHGLWPPGKARVGLKFSQGFEAYERPGELSGSAVLGHDAALEPYARAIVERARRDGVLYLELRGSPHKYRAQGAVAFVAELEAALRRAGAQTSAFDHRRPGPRVGFIWILDRRHPEQWTALVRSAVDAAARLPSFMLGLDVAGDEAVPTSPAALAAAFEPAFRECLRITIHAGEGESAENIWDAAYHLHADRIGHGLTLPAHPQLMQRFRDRGILVELCPTSNREVVGFNDPAYPDSQGHPQHPLSAFAAAGVPVALCTDNPGISRTTLAGEYVAASRMTGGLTLWGGLGLLRQAYDHAFVSSEEKLALRRFAEARIVEQFAVPLAATQA